MSLRMPDCRRRKIQVGCLVIFTHFSAEVGGLSPVRWATKGGEHLAEEGLAGVEEGGLLLALRQPGLDPLRLWGDRKSPP